MTYLPVCLSECDKISRLPIPCVNYTFINQVTHIHIKSTYDLCETIYLYIKFFYIHIKFPDIHVKTAFPYQCNYAYIKPTFLLLIKNSYQVNVNIFINQESLVPSISKRKRESENQPYNKQHLVAANLFIPNAEEFFEN